MLSRLIQNWVYGGFLAGLLLLALLPTLAADWSWALFAVFLQLPLYMVHQYEEHDHDRFRLFVNQNLGNGRELLSPFAVFVINVPGVWGVDALSFYLTHEVAFGYGLIAIDLTLVNGIVHIIAAIVTRRYNPGLVTAALLFLPIGIWSLQELQKTEQIKFTDHLLGLSVAIAIHVAIIGYAQLRKRQIIHAEQDPLSF